MRSSKIHEGASTALLDDSMAYTKNDPDEKYE